MNIKQIENGFIWLAENIEAAEVEELKDFEVFLLDNLPDDAR